MAESLSGSDLDEVIRHPQIFETSSSVTSNHADPSTIDTKFPPFPLKDVEVLDKHKRPNKEKGGTTRRPPTPHRQLDYRKGKF